MDDDTPTEEEQLLQDQIPDAASAKSLKKSEERSRRRLEQSADFWQKIFDTQIGREEVWKILSECHTFETKFACGPSGYPQSEATWFHAGEQQLGLRLYHSWLIMCPEGVLQMHRENDNRFPPQAKQRRVSLKGKENG